MAKLSTFTEAEQLPLEELLAEFRAEVPPEAAREGRKEPSVATAGVDPDAAGADLETVGDISEAKIGTDPHNGACPYAAKCDKRRRRLSTYREGIPCHWVSFWNVAGCPIYRMEVTTNDNPISY